MTAAPRVGARTVALGGGHGLAVTLQALRRITDDITAIVGVSDDGGSSGRLRREFGLIPPGDLRMALAALCGDDAWGRTWARVVQHRFGGDGELAGHALGNLLLAGLWEHTDDVVTGLAWAAELLDAQGRVLPLAKQPLDIVAEVSGLAAEHVTVRGQVSVARTTGHVEVVRLEPANVPASTEALHAVREADAILIGPGSWYTSVLPHFMLPDMRTAIVESRGTRICILNLVPQAGETSDFHLHTHLDVLHALAPELRLDYVVTDPAVNAEPEALTSSAAAMGATVIMDDVVDPGDSSRHSPDLLAAAIRILLPSRSEPGVAG